MTVMCTNELDTPAPISERPLGGERPRIPSRPMADPHCMVGFGGCRSNLHMIAYAVADRLGVEPNDLRERPRRFPRRRIWPDR